MNHYRHCLRTNFSDFFKYKHNISSQENAFESFVRKMSTLIFRTHCINRVVPLCYQEVILLAASKVMQIVGNWLITVQWVAREVFFLWNLVVISIPNKYSCQLPVTIFLCIISSNAYLYGFTLYYIYLLHSCWIKIVVIRIWAFIIKRSDVLPPNLVKPWSHEIGFYNDRIDLKFDRHLGSAAAEVPVKFEIDWKSLNSNLATSKISRDLAIRRLTAQWIEVTSLLTMTKSAAVDRCRVLILPPFSDCTYLQCLNLDSRPVLRLSQCAAATVACHCFCYYFRASIAPSPSLYKCINIYLYKEGAGQWKHENNNKNSGKRLWLQRGSSSNTQQTCPWTAPSYQIIRLQRLI